MGRLVGNNNWRKVWAMVRGAFYDTLSCSPRDKKQHENRDVFLNDLSDMHYEPLLALVIFYSFLKLFTERLNPNPKLNLSFASIQFK